MLFDVQFTPMDETVDDIIFKMEQLGQMAKSL
jgi:hypothetical protein